MTENNQDKNFDRHTALEILKDLSHSMYPSNDLFGTKTLVINRDKFEKIRKKYLDNGRLSNYGYI